MKYLGLENHMKNIYFLMTCYKKNKWQVWLIMVQLLLKISGEG